MEKEKKLAICKKAISQHGTTKQTIVAMEELSELIKELSKSLRGIAKKENLVEELADVEIMIDQIKLMYIISDAELEDEIGFKLVRLNNRLNEEHSDEETY